MTATAAARAATVVALTLLLGLTAADAAKKPGGPSPGPTTFELSGHVSDLFPAGRSSLPLKIENPFAFDVMVGSTVVTVGDASAACMGTVLAVGAIPSVRVAAGGEVTVDVAITMAPDAPDACQGATFPLTYRANATQAN